jgi:glycosyltransferase involved in cell wall biosynthesis
MIYTPVEKWNRLHIIHCGVDPDSLEPVRHDGVGSRILFVGRLARVKGLHVLLEAAASLIGEGREMVVNIVGDGPDRESLERRAVDLGIREQVTFHGYRTQEQVREHLQETDIFALPSFAEGVPVVLMEAMAAGLPVLSTRIAGISELVDDNLSGFLVPPGDRQGFTDRLRTLQDDPQLRSRLGTAGREKVTRDFNLRYESERFCRILKTSLDGGIPPIREELSPSRFSDMGTPTRTP